MQMNEMATPDTPQGLGQAALVDELPSLSTKPRPKRDLAESEELRGEELFLFDRDSGAVLRLNGGASVVWLLCDGTRDVASIAKEIAADSGLPEPRVLVDVQEAVALDHVRGNLVKEQSIAYRSRSRFCHGRQYLPVWLLPSHQTGDSQCSARARFGLQRER